MAPSTAIGIDLGTSNCAAAVWDSTRGHPKWMRLSVANSQNGKMGRVVPSVVVFLDESALPRLPLPLQRFTEDVSSLLRRRGEENESSVLALVGAGAVNLLEDIQSNASSHVFNAKEVSAATVTSVKRSLFTGDQGSRDDEEIQIQPLGSNKTLTVTTIQVMAALLRSIRLASQEYLKSNMQKKKLVIPGNTWQVAQHCVIGIPAHSTHKQRAKVLESAELAGIGADASTIIESTAAAMAYGLFASSSGGGSVVDSSSTDDEIELAAPHEKLILVFDMGGGTTDITIAAIRSSGADGNVDEPDFRVLATAGNPQLGGDDMDQAILERVLEKARGSSAEEEAVLSRHDKRLLLRRCKRAKEQLCGDVDHGYTQPAEMTTIQVPHQGGFSTVRFDQSDLKKILQPILKKIWQLINETLKRLATTSMDEVILVGGASRVPAVRDYLKQKVPPRGQKELCLSVNAMAAVAQGAAVQAAINSELVPLHELRSAMMLDTVPHDIGVLLESDTSKSNQPKTFVCIIPRDATLPAKGTATFCLASAQQHGVTVNAMERVYGNSSSDDEKASYVSLGDFTFLLHRLTGSQKEALPEGKRLVDIQMTLRETGEFVVAVLDENDPDQKRRRRLKRSKDDGTHSGLLHFPTRESELAEANVVSEDEEGIPREQQMLIVACVVLFVLYVYLKIAFQEARDFNAPPSSVDL